MNEELIKKELLSKANDKDGKLTIACATTMEIADKFSATPIEVGNICNQMGIKIKNCQLGCF